MNTPKRYTITAALPYTNGPIHIGHLAGVYVPADIYARYLRLTGKDVAYICGSDEHGAAITLRAKKEDINPQQIIDKYHNLNKGTFEQLGVSFDIYHRTSEALHHETALDFFMKLNGGQMWGSLPRSHLSRRPALGSAYLSGPAGHLYSPRQGQPRSQVPALL